MNPLSTLTPLERKYFKLYAQAAKRDFDVMSTAAFLMQPTELGVACPVHACRIAEELLELQASFNGSLALVAHKHKLRRRQVSTAPSDDQIATLVASSFFKVVAVVNSPYSLEGVHKDAGWFSGASEEWQKNLAAVKAAWAAPKSDPFSSILTAFAQLFQMASHGKLPFASKFFPVANQNDEEWQDDDDDDPAAPEDID